MLAKSLRVSRCPSLGQRLAHQQPLVRTFIVPSVVRNADSVQSIYLRELKNYVPPPVKASDSEGQVKKWSPPPPPPSPLSQDASLAEELKAYQAQEVEVEGQATGEPGAEAKEEDWFEEEANFGEGDAKH